MKNTTLYSRRYPPAIPGRPTSAEPAEDTLRDLILPLIEARFRPEAEPGRLQRQKRFLRIAAKLSVCYEMDVDLWQSPTGVQACFYLMDTSFHGFHLELLRELAKLSDELSLVSLPDGKHTMRLDFFVDKENL